MPKTILIAEDDRGVAKQLSRAIEEAGYACQVAADGAAALEQVESARPDLVLLDLLLPKKDGRQVLASLQSSDATRDIPVVAMSGVFRGRATARELHDAGAQGFLDKPFSGEDLMAHVHALIGPPEEKKAESSAAAPAADQIPLEEHDAAELLWRAMSEGFSGALQFQQDKRHKVVVLDKGAPVQVRSNQASECLGRRLFRAGRIDGDALQVSLQRAREQGGRQGEILVSMGVITEEDVEHELLAQAEDKLLELFNWESGRFWRQPNVKSISFATDLSGWTPRLVVLRGVSRMDVTRARRLLEPIAQLRLAVRESDLSDEELLIPHIAETIAVIRSGADTAELIQGNPAGLYGLWLTGIARLIDPESGQVVTDVMPGAQAETAAVPAPADAASPAPAAAAPGPASDPGDAEVQRLRAELAEMQDKDYFELLGLERTAAGPSARKAFMRLAKSYHPDRFAKKSPEAKAAASEIFALLSSASDTLADDKLRKEYLHKLKSGRSAAEERQVVERILGAEQRFSKGEGLFRTRAYAEALAEFAAALEAAPDEAEYHAYFGWTHYLVHRDGAGAAELARNHLEKAVALAPRSVTGYYFLGQLHKACNEDQAAQKMFRKILELKPDHVEAARELRLMEMRKGKDDKPGGLFGFGKKRK